MSLSHVFEIHLDSVELCDKTCPLSRSSLTSCALHVRIQRGGRGSGPLPLKNRKKCGFSSNTGPDPLKNCSYQASIQCWAIIGTPAKRHLMAFRWRANDGPLIVVHGSSPHILKKKKKKNLVLVGPSLTKLSGSAHALDKRTLVLIIKNIFCNS